MTLKEELQNFFKELIIELEEHEQYGDIYFPNWARSLNEKLNKEEK